MFAIFVISLMSLFLIPFTIYKLCNAASGEAAKPWETVSTIPVLYQKGAILLSSLGQWVKDVMQQAERQKEAAIKNRLRRLLNPTSIALIVAWLVLFGLLYYVQQFAKELSPFDPFDILKVAIIPGPLKSSPI